MPPPLPLLLLLLLSAPPALSQAPSPKRIRIDCGATGATAAEGWEPDDRYVSSGGARSIDLLGLSPTLSTLRAFPYRPSDGPRKFCYTIPIFARANYLLRTTFFYGGLAGLGAMPPVFDLVVDGTVWTLVNTTGDYVRRMASYYELVFRPKDRKFARVCLAGNRYTESDMFISAIELVMLGPSVYNSTDFNKYALGLVSRSNFGGNGSVLRYPDDLYDRYWLPLTADARVIRNARNVSVSGFWNLPPSKIFETSFISEKGKPLDMQWPVVPLRRSNYYIALYFLNPASESSMTFDISINGIDFYKNLSVTSSGAAIFATNWTLSGLTNIKLNPTSSFPTLINGGEIFGLLTFEGATMSRDVIALSAVKKMINNPPSGWEGDPCLPRDYSWRGVKCSGGLRPRITALNFSNMGLAGTLSPRIASLTALNNILLDNNSFSGPIPDLSLIKGLERLHLQDNNLSGSIPPSLGELSKLRELFLQNNNLTGGIPSSLRNKLGLNLKISPGNNLSP